MKVVARVALVLLAGTWAGCRSTGGLAVRPIPTVGAVAARTSDRLAVLLPGRDSVAADFRGRGFEAALRAAADPIDVLAVEAHLGYYRDGLLPRVLAEDILRPARAAGYREIWIIGTSMGGVGALASLKEFPDLVDGVMILGPFLGENDLIEKAERLGPEIGQRERSEDPVEAYFEDLWAWLETEKVAKARILLGYGIKDRYRAGQQRLAMRLPSDNVVAVPGGHDWKAWRAAVKVLGARMKKGN